MDMKSQTGYGQKPVYYPPDYDPSLNGIGGWLILLIIGRFLAFTYIFALPILVSFYGYSATLDTYITAGICFNLIEMVLSILVLVFIFSRKIVFRTFFIIQYSLSVIFLFLITISFSDHGPDVSLNQWADAISSVVFWIPYVFVSKRVKNTFIYPKLYPDYKDMSNFPSYPSHGASPAADVAKEADTAPKVSAEPEPDRAYCIKDIQIPDSDQVECPVCNAVQRNDRSFCYKCGARFIQ